MVWFVDEVMLERKAEGATLLARITIGREEGVVNNICSTILGCHTGCRVGSHRPPMNQSLSWKQRAR